MAKFKYQENDPEESRKHADRRGDFDKPIKDKFKVYGPREGKNRIRILPRTWTDGPKHWAWDIYRHFSIGPDNASYPCPAKMGWGKCPMCEERQRLDAEGDEDGARELRASKAMMTWIIDRNAEEDGPQIFLMPANKVESEICELSRDEDTGEIKKIDSPDDGYDVSFTKTGKGLNTDYKAIVVSSKKSAVSQDEDQQDEWLEYIADNPLPECVNQYSYEYLQGVFSGVKSSRSEDSDAEEVKPARARQRPSRVEAEDDEEEVETPRRNKRKIDDEDAELDEEPKASKRRPTEDDDEEEEEVVETPRNRLRDEVRGGLKKRRERATAD